ncbi:MAG: undecaprenyl/decaprenyl-phosphate alpha-N-acetylglucosaminyl 1-phosphate transferase [Candidatus Gracilibacteria bacterium]|nr:undecaprenyl/decaprenyl-phosphate alpha-N-acetylglucosaminyl 1-phosphate transferase [Candidatus Gracilibacteria bacterium]
MKPETIVFASALSFTISLLGSLFVMRFFPKWRIIDNPQKYGHQRNPIPLPGSVFIIPTFVVISLIFLPFSKHLLALTLGAIIMYLVAFIDDRKGLPATFRLMIQVTLGLLVVACGIGIDVITSPIGGYLNLSKYEINIPIGDIFYQITILADLFTIIWIVLMINTLNWLDGVVGLSASSSMLSALAIGFLSISDRVNQTEMGFLSFVFAFSILGFLIFNIHPPKMLLGDTGAMPMGFTLAVLSIFSGGKIATAFITLAIPLLDAFYVISSRLLKGQKPWKGQDKAHLHDRLLILGANERHIFYGFFATSSILGIYTLFLDTLGKGILILSVFAAYFLMRFLIERKIKILQNKAND